MESSNDTATNTAMNTAAVAAALLAHYSFDMGSEFSPEQIIVQWAKVYEVSWLHLAVIEALYQGRYKVFSVEQILNLWQRRGRPTFHFNSEFERLVCHRMPQDLHTRLKPALAPQPVEYSLSAISSQRKLARIRQELPWVTVRNRAIAARAALVPVLPSSSTTALALPIKYTDFLTKLKAVIENSQELPTENQAAPEPPAITVEAKVTQTDDSELEDSQISQLDITSDGQGASSPKPAQDTLNTPQAADNLESSELLNPPDDTSITSTILE
ncbi:MAG: hypothetical protein ACFBSC_15925 [Microcoleaceae cyanobacterium]